MVRIILEDRWGLFFRICIATFMFTTIIVLEIILYFMNVQNNAYPIYSQNYVSIVIVNSKLDYCEYSRWKCLVVIILTSAVCEIYTTCCKWSYNIR